MSAVLLDTTVVIDLLRGRTQAAARLRALHDAGDSAYVSAINVEETVRAPCPGQTRSRGDDVTVRGKQLGFGLRLGIRSIPGKCKHFPGIHTSQGRSPEKEATSPATR